MAFFALILIAGVKQLLIFAKVKLNMEVGFNNTLKG
jgi:hypothetical protein